MPESQSHQDAIDRTRIVLRPLGSAMPLGFFAFGAGALMTAVWDLHWVPKTDYKAAAIALLTFVLPLEMLACLFSFFSRDAAGATAMGVFSATWGVFATYWLVIGPIASPVLGVFACMLAGIVLCLAGAAWRAKPLLAVLLVVACIRDCFLAAFHLGAAPALAGVGWCGLALTGFSLYGGLAFLLEDMNQQTVLPLMRRGPARTSMEGSLAQQLQRIEQEAGVRNQLNPSDAVPE